MSLDAERPEDGAERRPRLEHGPLLDVQLEVGGGRLELERASSARSRSSCFARASGNETSFASTSWRSSSWSAIEPAAALEPKRLARTAPSSSAQLTSRP